MEARREMPDEALVPVRLVGVVTDAKPEAVEFHQVVGFAAVEGVREGLLHGEPLPMFLAIDTIASALKG
jgi:hypothetical protein